MATSPDREPTSTQAYLYALAQWALTVMAFGLIGAGALLGIFGLSPLGDSEVDELTKLNYAMLATGVAMAVTGTGLLLVRPPAPGSRRVLLAHEYLAHQQQSGRSDGDGEHSSDDTHQAAADEYRDDSDHTWDIDR